MEFISETSSIRQIEPPRRALFMGSGGTLFGVYVRNILLTLITLGIYYFWGKNRTRQYLVSHSEFEGDRFSWHGTGKELFLGMLKLLLIAVPVIGLVVAAQVYWPEGVAAAVLTAAIYAGYLLLVPLLVVGARRYRFSRLSWRGIRFSFRGRFWEFFRLYLRGLVLTALTLGLYYPYFQTAMRRFLTRHAYFGSTGFAFDGEGRDLLGPFLLLIAAVIASFLVAGALTAAAVFSSGTPPTEVLPALVVPFLIAAAVAGMAWLWFIARRHRYFWMHTSFASARFRSTVTTLPLLALLVTNLLLLVATIGLAWPWVAVRNARFLFHHVMLEGPLDLAGVIQDAQAAGATAEAAADVFDIDILGIDLPL